MRKNNKSLLIYWNISGIILWIVIFLLGLYVSGLEIYDAIQIPSILLLCAYLFYQLIKWGLMDKTIVKYHNRFLAGAYTNAKRKKDGLEEVQKITTSEFRTKMKTKNNPIIYVFITIYITLIIASLFI